MRTPFFGPAYKDGSRNVAYNRLVNLYPEVVEVQGAGKDVGAFLSAPGLDLLVTLGTGPIRGLDVVNGVLYVVSGSKLYSVTSPRVVTLLGNLNTSSGPVSMIHNVIGTLQQLCVFDGQAGWIATSNPPNSPTYQQLNLPFGNSGASTAASGPPVFATYQDTFGLVNVSGTNLWYQSNPGDLSTWAPLDYSAADSFPDNVLALISFHNEIWLLKQNDTEVWYDAGNEGFSFSRLQGTFIEGGIAAPFSLVKGGESLFWLSANPQGGGVAVMATSYNPERISTHPIEAEWQAYTTISDALGWCYQQQGHLFYVLTFPTAGKTWVYDVTASAILGTPCWHERASLENGTLLRHWGNAFATFNGQQILGDYRNGNIYAMDPAQPLDNGAQRKWVRTWRALAKPSDEPVKFSNLRIDMLTGIGAQNGANPLAVLRWSDDGGYTWTSERFAAIGPIGMTALRVKFTQLGGTRRNHGLDRIFELSSTDVTQVALVGAVLE